MSLSDKIQSEIQKIVNLYIESVSSKYDLDKNELLILWNNNTNIKSNQQNIIVNEDKKENNNTLIKLSKAELVEMCKSKKLKTGGTKQDLVDRLSGEEKCNMTSISSKIEKKVSPPIIKKLIEKIPSIQIRRNKFDNFEHEETSFVFNNKTQKVYGKQNKDGSVADLTSEDIDLCNKYKFSYYIPENLDKKDILKNIETEDIEDEEFEVEEELELDEDEEFEEEEEEEEEYYEDD